MTPKIKLSFKAGFQVGSVKEFETDNLTIGRDPENLLTIDDIEVSRKHAGISFLNQEFFLEDFQSTNGTFLNGKKIKKPEKLESGDLITFGETVVLEFSFNPQNISEFNTIDDNTFIFDYPDAVMKPDEFMKEPDEFVKEPNVKAVDEYIKISQDKQSVLNKLPAWLIILIIALAFLVIFCFIPFIVIEVTNQWCNLFSGFFNAISTGACP